MKKQLSVFALAAASVAIGMTSAHATVPGSTQFHPDNDLNPYTGSAMNATGHNAETITVGGTIPEFIQFTAVDDAIELGDIGGPLLTTRAISISGRKDAGSTTASFTKNTNSGPNDGDAKIEFNANTFVQIKFSGTDLRNAGPDGTLNNTDDFTLPTFYRVSTKGKIQFADNSGNIGGIFNGPGSTGQNPTNPGDYPSYSGEVAAANTTDVNMTYSPGGPVNDGYGATAPLNTPSGLRIMAEVDRKGLNDYRGDYSTTLALTYFKY